MSDLHSFPPLATPSQTSEDVIWVRTRHGHVYGRCRSALPGLEAIEFGLAECVMYGGDPEGQDDLIVATAQLLSRAPQTGLVASCTEHVLTRYRCPFDSKNEGTVVNCIVEVDDQQLNDTV